jgi:hypothetical protein
MLLMYGVDRDQLSLLIPHIYMCEKYVFHGQLKRVDVVHP